jgi:hypothetical protein
MNKIIIIIIIINSFIFSQDKINYNIEFINIKPNGYFLNPAVNNPYSPNLCYTFGLPDTSNIVITIKKDNIEDYSLYLSKVLNPGIYLLRWNGRNNFEDNMIEGIFVLSIYAECITNNNLQCIYRATTKIILLR